MVVAASGAGKSSLLRAGLLPQVAAACALTPAGSRYWPRVVFTPGAHPMRAAANALRKAFTDGSGASVPPDPGPAELDDLLAAAAAAAGPEARAVMVVDQFEELFRLCEQEDERGAFISWLWQAAQCERAGGPAVLAACAVRADFYHDCTGYPQIRQALQDNQVIVGAMSPEELREVITCPAEAVGLNIEPGLTELLLADLHAGPLAASAGNGSLAADDGAGRLPLLAHALRVTWQQRPGSTLPVDGYRVTGGIEHAIADSAEQVYARLDDGSQWEARGLFLRLVKIGATRGEDVRRPVPRQGLAGESAGVGAVIDACTAARLLTQSVGTIQITHEALLRAWPRLAGWLDDDRAGQLTRQQVEDAAAEWDQVGREASLLYGGARLETTAAWAGSHGLQLTATARDFISASRRRARRTRLIRRGAIAVLAVLLLVASVTTAVAFIQRSTADRQTRLAQSEARTARSEAMAARSETKRAQSEAMAAEAVSLLSADVPLAMLLSLQAYERDPTSQASSALIEAAQQPVDALLTAGAAVESVAFSPDGRILRLSYMTLQRRHPPPPPACGTWRPGRKPRRWPTATWLAAWRSARTGASWQPATSTAASACGTWRPGRKPPPWTRATRCGAWRSARTGASWRPVVTAASACGTWRLGRKTATLADSNGVGSVAFSPDGHTLAGDPAAGDSGDISLWNVATGQKTATVTLADRYPVYSVAFSPDGRTLAAAATTAAASACGTWRPGRKPRRWPTATRSRAWRSARTGAPRRPHADNGGGSISFVERGDRAENRDALADGNWVSSVAFSPDGSAHLAASTTTTATSPCGTWRVLSSHTSPQTARSPAWRSAPTGAPWRSASTTTAASTACGTWRPGRKPRRWPTATGLAAWHSAPTGAPWRSATTTAASACGTWRPPGRKNLARRWPTTA